jgi:hypothetical protein
MHAVVVKANIHDRDAATASLKNQIVPTVSGAPGFVAGYWINVGEGRGTSVVVFESEEHAQAVASQIQPPGDFVSFESVTVGEVVANA